MYVGFGHSYWQVNPYIPNPDSDMFYPSFFISSAFFYPSFLISSAFFFLSCFLSFFLTLSSCLTSYSSCNFFYLLYDMTPRKLSGYYLSRCNVYAIEYFMSAGSISYSTFVIAVHLTQKEQKRLR